MLSCKGWGPSLTPLSVAGSGRLMGNFSSIAASSLYLISQTVVAEPLGDSWPTKAEPSVPL